MSDKVQPLYVLNDPDPKVNLVIVYNPLDLSDRETAELVWGHKRTLSDYLDGLPDDIDWAVCVNGEVIDEDKLGQTCLYPDDYITVIPSVHGGRGGKMILRIITLIVVAALSVYTGGAVGAAYGSMYGAAAAAAVSVIGSVLVNALIPMPPPSSKDLNRDSEDSPSYGLDGAKNTSIADIPVPVVYGEFRTAGNIVDMFVENVNNTQNLYMRTAVSEGEIFSISDVEINGQPVSAYQNVELDVRLGTDNQPFMGWFGDTIIPRSKGVKLNTSYFYHTTEVEVDKLRLDVSFPMGLCDIDPKTGVKRDRMVGFDAAYRRVGTETWISMGQSTDNWIQYYGASTPDNARGLKIVVRPTITTTYDYNYDYGYYSEYGIQSLNYSIYYRVVGAPSWTLLKTENQTAALDTYNGGYYLDTGDRTAIVESLPAGLYEFYVTGASTLGTYYKASAFTAVHGAQRSAVRTSFMTPLLSEGYYEVRIRRTNDESTDDYIIDQCFLSDVNEIIVDDVRYNYTAMLGLKIRFTDQLNSQPTVTALVRGRKVNRYNRRGEYVDTVFTSNPAWVVLDILTNTRYGGGLALNRINLVKWWEWANYCANKGLSFDAPFEMTGNVWDAIQQVCRVGHAQVIMVGTTYSVAIEKADTPTMMFDMGNIIKDTFSINWLPLNDRANEIEINYFDKADSYKKHSVKVGSVDTNGAPQRSASITLPGITSRDRALFEANLQLAMNKYILQTVSFDAPVEAIACTIGSLVYVQHDMPQWGYGGRLEKGSTASLLKVDQPLTMEANKTYIALAHLSAVKRLDATISFVGYNYVQLSGLAAPLPSNIKRLKIAGGDFGIEAINGSNELVLDRTNGLTIGMPCELWDTDVIEERSVIPTIGNDITEIKLSRPLSAAPEEFANFMFGENTKVKKPFRVIGINGSGEDTRSLTLLEYNENVYQNPGAVAGTINYSSLSVNIGQVTDLLCSEELYITGGVIRTRLRIEWNTPTTGLYEGADVFVNLINGAVKIPLSVPSVGAGATSTYLEVNDGDVLEIKVVAYDSAGKRAPSISAPVIQHTVIGQAAPPANVTGFNVSRVVGGLEFSWNNNIEIDVVGYEIRMGTSWSVAEVLVSDFSGTRFVSGNAQPSQTYLIKAIDARGNYSKEPAYISLDLPTPAAVRGFQAIQNGSIINLVWEYNLEKDVVRYEIREGVNWGSGALVGRTPSNNLSIISAFTGARTFWIKAIDSSGFYGSTAVFAIANVLPPDNRNIIVSQDDKANAWPGLRYKMEVFEGNLVMENNSSHSEYMHHINLPSEYFARVVVDDAIDSIGVTNIQLWSEANYAWSSFAASRVWYDAGNIENLTTERLFSRNIHTLAADELEAFGLSGDLIGLNNTAPNSSVGAAYVPGRFRDGLLVDDTTKVDWNVNVPSEFNISFWMLPHLEEIETVYLYLSAAIGNTLTLKRNASGTVSLIGSDKNDIEVNTGSLLNRHVFVTIFQTATQRGIKLGTPEEGVIASGIINVAPVGSFDAIKLYYQPS